MHKRCPRCGKNKPATNEFYYRDIYQSSGWSSKCRECAKKYAKNKYVVDSAKDPQELINTFVEQIAKFTRKYYEKLDKILYAAVYRATEGKVNMHEMTKQESKEWARENLYQVREHSTKKVYMRGSNKMIVELPNIEIGMFYGGSESNNDSIQK